MTVALKLSPGTEGMLLDQAHAGGLSLDQFVSRKLEFLAAQSSGTFAPGRSRRATDSGSGRNLRTAIYGCSSVTD